MEVEGLINDGGGVDMHPVEGQSFLLPGKKTGLSGVVREISVCKEPDEYGAAAFVYEEIAPFRKHAAPDMENALIKQPAKDRGDGSCNVEEATQRASPPR